MIENDPTWTEYEERDVFDDEYPLSASAIKKFNRCPKSFELYYELNNDAPTGDSEYAELGSAVHESIERVLKAQNGINILDHANQLEEMMFGEYRGIDPKLPDSMFEDGLQYLEVAARYIAGRDTSSMRGVEKKFEVAMSEPLDVAFKGIIDVATDHEVWDWKTGKVREEAEMIQGMVYALGYYHEFGEVPNKIRFVYLKEEKERIFDPTDENWEKMIRHVRSILESRQTGEFGAQPEESKCYWCDMEGFCPSSVVGAGGVRWEVF